jgi:hypothetical protein
MAEHHEPQPQPTVWPVGFAIGVAVLLVGLIINPLWVSSIGGAIALVFGFLWAREATAELRRRRRAARPCRIRSPASGSPAAGSSRARRSASAV